MSIVEITEMAQLVSELADKLIQSKYSVATAESCTGGAIGAALTSVSGSSGWYKGGVIAYSNEIKTNLLKVDSALIKQFGAVSTEVAQAMSEGVRSVTGSHIGLSTTGIAGPNGGSDEKPVGTLCFGWSINGSFSTERLVFKGDRQQIQHQSVLHSIKRLIELL